MKLLPQSLILLLTTLTVLSFASSSPGGNVTYTLHKAASPTADQQDAYDKITSAMERATEYYCTYTSITKALNIYYEPSVQTADGNSNGTIRFGKNRSYMVVLTALHEIAHTVGIGTSQEYRNLIQNGVFTGEKGTAMLKEVTGDPGAVLKGDQQHFWPYGLNYASEYNSDDDYVFHCKIVNAMYQDMHPDLAVQTLYKTCYIRSHADHTYMTATSDDELVLGQTADSSAVVNLIRLGDDNIFRLEFGKLVLDIPNESTQSGAAVGLWNWNGGNHQKASVEFDEDSSTVRIKMVNSGLYLQADGGRIVQENGASDLESQVWELVDTVDDVTTVSTRRVHGRSQALVFSNGSIFVSPQAGRTTLVLTDLNGRIVFNRQIAGSSRIATAKLAPGVYCVRLSGSGVSLVERFVVR